jgi:dTMP kinase
MDALTEACWSSPRGATTCVQVIQPALQRGDVVLCDRFTDSTFAYQGGGQGLDTGGAGATGNAGCRPWTRRAGGLVQPDLTLWFDLPPAQAAARLAQVRAPDRFEVRGEAFFIRVREAYAARARAAPQRFVQIDAAADRGTVWQAVSAAVRGRGWMA